MVLNAVSSAAWDESKRGIHDCESTVKAKTRITMSESISSSSSKSTVQGSFDLALCCESNYFAKIFFSHLVELDSCL